jgi:hypothetical protein
VRCPTQRKSLREATAKTGARDLSVHMPVVSIAAELKLLQQLCEGHVLKRQVSGARG